MKRISIILNLTLFCCAIYAQTAEQMLKKGNTAFYGSENYTEAVDRNTKAANKGNAEAKRQREKN